MVKFDLRNYTIVVELDIPIVYFLGIIELGLDLVFLSLCTVDLCFSNGDLRSCRTECRFPAFYIGYKGFLIYLGYDLPSLYRVSFFYIQLYDLARYIRADLDLED